MLLACPTPNELGGTNFFSGIGANVVCTLPLSYSARIRLNIMLGSALMTPSPLLRIRNRLGVAEQTMETITMTGDSESVCLWLCVFSKQTSGISVYSMYRSRAEGTIQISANHLLLAQVRLLLWFLSETKGPCSISSVSLWTSGPLRERMALMICNIRDQTCRVRACWLDLK